MWRSFVFCCESKFRVVEFASCKSIRPIEALNTSDWALDPAVIGWRDVSPAVQSCISVSLVWKPNWSHFQTVISTWGGRLCCDIIPCRRTSERMIDEHSWTCVFAGPDSVIMRAVTSESSSGNEYTDEFDNPEPSDDTEFWRKGVREQKTMC